MDGLIQLVLSELPESLTSCDILQVVPRFVKEAEALAVPGAEKKAAALKALHALLGLLQEKGKVSEDLAKELDAFIDGTVATTINMLIGVSKGQIKLALPKTVEEVSKQVNCCFSFIHAVLGIVRAAQKSKAVAKQAPEAVTATEQAPEAVTDTEQAPEHEIPVTPTPNTTPVSEKEVALETVVDEESTPEAA